MNQVRFQIGIPRAGSAARQSEQDDTFTAEPVRMERPRAGSAARAAEAEKAASGRTASSQAGFSLRGQGGTVTRNVAASAMSSAAFGTPSRPHELKAQSTPVQERNADELSSDEQALAGPLHLAASRFQTLVRSLFSSGDTTGESKVPKP